MINPPAKIKPPTKMDSVTAFITKQAKTVSRERDLVIAVFFLVLGFVMGRL